MARPIKWSRDLHVIREKAARSRTETWSRVDLERLLNVGRATAQMLMKAIGDLQLVGGAHFVGRTSLLHFLDVLIGARPWTKRCVPGCWRPNRLRVEAAACLARTIFVNPGCRTYRLTSSWLPHYISILLRSVVSMLDRLVAGAMSMQNDLGRVGTSLRLPSVLISGSPFVTSTDSNDRLTWQPHAGSSTASIGWRFCNIAKIT